MSEPVAIRPAELDDAPDLARILVETNRATFHGLVPEKCLDFSIETSERNWHRTLKNGLSAGQILHVAVSENDEILGYALAGGVTGRDDYPRELNVLMVATPWQRKGIGRKLVTHAARILHKQGVHAILVGVQIDNPNRAFYEHLGARHIGEKPLDWDGYMTTELLYGWDNITCLWSDTK